MKLVKNIFYSFPIQLLILHLRNNLLLIITWVFFALIMTGTLGSIFGVQYLFLTPEYQGEVNFWSFFLLGFAFGSFLISWNLTTYLLDAHHFPFLASLSRPFTKFCLNNLIVPLSFVIIYLAKTIHFQWYYEYWSTLTIIVNCFGFLIGTITLILLSAVYFQYTNKDILNFLKIRKKRPPNLIGGVGPGRRSATLETIKSGVSKWRVDTYLTETLRPRLVRSVSHYDSSILLSVFKQNHINALVVQLMGLVVLIILGYLIDYSIFRIPAGASIFILGSVLVAITGAVTYWFDKWRITVLVLLLVAVNFLTSYDFFNHKNKAYGLSYTQDLAKYDYNNLDEICKQENVTTDKNNTINILNNWKAKTDKKDGTKPKMVIFCVSGGGMKAAVWSMRVLQQVDSILNGQLMNHTALITGASGGLIGSAYLRELYLRKQNGEDIDIYDKKYLDHISKDLLNSIGFTIVTNDLFLPWSTFKVGEHTYRKDRGYSFEKQLNENTNFVFEKTLKDYKQAEMESKIPMMFITPSIVNDGRRLIISPHGVSYMTIAPIGVERKQSIEIDAIDFGRLFEKQGAGDLRFTTALRMNATYPYILPNVYLPTEPGVEVMDAGFRDNYGIMSATRFIHVFKDWIENNTSGVVLVQVSAWDKFKEIKASDHEGIIESMFNPLGIAGQILELQDYEHDTNLGYIFDLLGKDKFDVIRFIYRPSKPKEKASMTFHLTKREKNDIINSYYQKTNQQSFQRLKKAMNLE